MNREKLKREYFSTHYRRFMPKTKEGWQWVIDRIDLNFGKFFESINRDSFILDVGCGVGYLEYYLLKKEFNKIRAVDISEEQIHEAQKKLSEYRLDFTDRVEFFVSDAFEFLKSGYQYSAIAIIDLLEHLKKEKALEILNLCYNALSSGGFLFIRVINADNPMFGRFFYRDFTHETPFTPESLRQCLEVVGFEVIKISYEKIPKMRRSKMKLISGFKQFMQRTGVYFLGKFLGFPPEAFTENLIAVAKKRDK